ncbi:MAG: RagB/SusD family nutrient uptake outer membrane protein [Niabella sp.]|nr:RagB/SusD family nutrient uptake outer membrane protein [Niabella sp.]
MKKILKPRFVVYLLFAVFGLSGCKKFLNVNPPLALSGNNFWKSSGDYEKFVLGLYVQFRSATMGPRRGSDVYTQFFPAVGDFRCAPVTNQVSGRDYIGALANNNLLYLTKNYTQWANGAPWQKDTDWGPFFKIIAGCNIMVDAINKDNGVLAPSEKGQYLGEAVFIRNLVFFMMARLYGDIPYSTKAFDQNPQPRQNMVQVLRNCYNDLQAVVNDMPWTFDDPTQKGCRAMKGSALDLMMNIDMWCAGFDANNKQTYWSQTDSLGNVLLTQNGNSYYLLPMDQMHQVFKGGTPESLFEIRQSLNAGEQFNEFSTFADNVLAQPFKTATATFAGYNQVFIKQDLFPDKNDKRWTTFFYEPPNNTDPFQMSYTKFTNVYAVPGEDVNPDDCQMVFRLPDALLLRAEAAASLGHSDVAVQMLNTVRARAGAVLYQDGERPGYDLLDIIFYERCKELLGESYYFFDLVRTGRIMDPKFCYHPISENDFASGAWTWPISTNALINNPGMQLNTYWSK